jgi:hypothetical protein
VIESGFVEDGSFSLVVELNDVMIDIHIHTARTLVLDVELAFPQTK